MSDANKNTPESLNGDPYGRNKIPEVPRKPVHFSLWRPIRGMVGGLLYGFLMQFYIMYYFGFTEKGMVDKNTGEGVGCMLFALFTHQICLPAAIALICGIGWWSISAIAGWIAFSLLVFFTFHLDKEKSREYWKDKLLPPVE